jgi:uncharacterized protein YbjT (DUF2867 family)
MTRILLAGATGMLGNRIATHLLEDPAVELRLLVRAGALDDSRKQRALEPLITAGARLREGDVTDPASLDEPTRDIEVVVSALQGDAEIVIDGQVALATAAATNGARRILPSDFAVDLFKATPGEHASFDLRRTADEQIAKLDLEQVNVLCGAFLDGMAMRGAVVELDSDAATATFWGTGQERFDATTVDDTARYAARVAADPDVPPGKFAAAAQQLCLDDIVTAFERADGRTYERRSRGSVDDLRRWTDERRAAHDEQGTLMGTYLLYMLSGQTALTDLQNDRYPDITPKTLADLP